MDFCRVTELRAGWRAPPNVICRVAMGRILLGGSLRRKVVALWRGWTLSRKAATFAMVGVINTAVDYCVFLVARAMFTRSGAALAAIAALSDDCHCANPTTLTLVISNLVSWSVAVTGSYILNSSITFATESGRRLRWGSYLMFIASGIVGWLANTATLVGAVELLLLPVWLAKAVAILASFLVNFSLSHFVVFRVRKDAPRGGGEV
jgi:putative flippase GtrA